MDFSQSFCYGTAALCKWSSIYLCLRRWFYASAVLSHNTGQILQGVVFTVGRMDSAIIPCIKHCFHCNLREELPIYIPVYLNLPRAYSLCLGDAGRAATACTAHADPPREFGIFVIIHRFSWRRLKTRTRTKFSPAKHCTV